MKTKYVKGWLIIEVDHYINEDHYDFKEIDAKARSLGAAKFIVKHWYTRPSVHIRNTKIGFSHYYKRDLKAGNTTLRADGSDEMAAKWALHHEKRGLK